MRHSLSQKVTVSQEHPFAKMICRCLCTVSISHATFTNKIPCWCMPTYHHNQRVHEVERVCVSSSGRTVGMGLKCSSIETFCVTKKRELSLSDIHLSVKNHCCCPLIVGISKLNYMFVFHIICEFKWTNQIWDSITNWLNIICTQLSILHMN